MRLGTFLKVLGIAGALEARSVAAACPEKILNDDSNRPYLCDTLTAKSDSDFMVFSISLVRTMGDSATRAAIVEMFMMYDIRDTYDSTHRMPVPPASPIEYGYGFVHVSKKDILALAKKAYVSNIFIHYSVPQVSVLVPSVPGHGRHPSSEASSRGARFDFRGRALPEGATGRDPALTPSYYR